MSSFRPATRPLLGAGTANLMQWLKHPVRQARRRSASWHLIDVPVSEFPVNEAADLIMAIESVYQAAGEPPEAEVFLRQGAVVRYTFLLSPELSRMAQDVLVQFDAVPCAQPSDLQSYARLYL
jgi:hypothetical protein